MKVADNDTPEITPAAGRASMPFRVSRNKGRLHVVPGDAAALIAAGRLDQRLFDAHVGRGDGARASVRCRQNGYWTKR